MHVPLSRDDQGWLKADTARDKGHGWGRGRGGAALIRLAIDSLLSPPLQQQQQKQQYNEILQVKCTRPIELCGSACLLCLCSEGRGEDGREGWRGGLPPDDDACLGVQLCLTRAGTQATPRLWCCVCLICVRGSALRGSALFVRVRVVRDEGVTSSWTGHVKWHETLTHCALITTVPPYTHTTQAFKQAHERERAR